MATDAPPADNAPPIRVLIVDDHQMVREALRAVLSAHLDIEVVGDVGDGAAGVRAGEELQPDVVLMDVFMPGMDGFEATQGLAEVAPDAKVIILTGQPAPEQTLRALTVGASGYLVKVEPASNLVEAIRSVVEGHVQLDASVETHVRESLQRKAKPAADTGSEVLTPREWEVLELAARGHTSREIAERLFISPKTVETHRERVMLKLSLGSRAEMVQFAVDRGLLQPSVGTVASSATSCVPCARSVQGQSGC